ncbi:hypothetical protein R3F77_05965 [Bradyrhizobium japonicum]|uniref:hypothetical protein n=1 Tax=Bradyrhizobium japonicum TaxID=375 RepID=UPI002B4A1D09|nr:hypothetical protein [Bradyrhizobium japonicum]WRJ93823.1 hypothetical protein R3F77_05965 [Bradyrhizobium japonicum]
MIRRRACVGTCSYPQREQKTWLRAVRLPFVGRQQILAAFMNAPSRTFVISAFFCRYSDQSQVVISGDS